MHAFRQRWNRARNGKCKREGQLPGAWPNGQVLVLAKFTRRESEQRIFCLPGTRRRRRRASVGPTGAVRWTERRCSSCPGALRLGGIRGFVGKSCWLGASLAGPEPLPVSLRDKAAGGHHSRNKC